MENLLKKLIKELDALIPFLALAHENVFTLIQHDHTVWFRERDEKKLPSTYRIYKKQISHGAFLLGYGYSEAFLSDLLRGILQRNPNILPEEKQLRFAEIRSVHSYEDVLKLMAEKEVYSVFAQSMENIAEYFQRKLNLGWPQRQKEGAIIASLIRNCIIHNSSIADARLEKASNHQYKRGTKIILDPTAVHSYGIVMRELARDLWRRANRIYLKKKKIVKL